MGRSRRQREKYRAVCRSSWGLLTAAGHRLGADHLMHSCPIPRALPRAQIIKRGAAVASRQIRCVCFHVSSLALLNEGILSLNNLPWFNDESMCTPDVRRRVPGYCRTEFKWHRLLPGGAIDLHAHASAYVRGSERARLAEKWSVCDLPPSVRPPPPSLPACLPACLP